MAIQDPTDTGRGPGWIETTMGRVRTCGRALPWRHMVFQCELTDQHEGPCQATIREISARDPHGAPIPVRGSCELHAALAPPADVGERIGRAVDLSAELAAADQKAAELAVQLAAADQRTETLLAALGRAAEDLGEHAQAWSARGELDRTQAKLSAGWADHARRSADRVTDTVARARAGGQDDHG